MYSTWFRTEKEASKAGPARTGLSLLTSSMWPERTAKLEKRNSSNFSADTKGNEERYTQEDRIPGG